MTRDMPAAGPVTKNGPMASTFFERHASLSPLAYRDYRLLLGGLALVNLVMPFQFLAQVFWVQDEYPGRSVLYASVIAASRGLAMVMFSLIGGAIADRVERRKVLLFCETGSLVVNGIVALVMLTTPFGSATVAAVTVCTFAAAGVTSIDSPARSASTPSVVGMANLAAAISLSTVVGQLMLPVSLSLVGVLSDVIDPAALYAASLLAWLGIIPLIAALRYHSVGGGGLNGGMVANIREGLGYARGSAIISGVLAVVLVVQLIGMPVATPLGPVFMIEELGFSSSQVGFMGMVWGLGALGGSFTLARMRWLTLRGITLAATALVFGAAVAGFGHSRYVPLTAVFDFAFGFGFTASMLVASTLVQHHVADGVRGRVMGLFPFTLGFANLCTAPIGAAGQRFGLAFTIPAMGWAAVFLCGLVFLRSPRLLTVRPQATHEEAVAAAG